VGFWTWELRAAPPDWHAGARFVHEVWAPSRFAADAIAPSIFGKVRVAPTRSLPNHRSRHGSTVPISACQPVLN
jgi:hypothetical protein